MDYDTIRQAKENELNFCRSWSTKVIEIADIKAQFIFCKDFRDDYFLNRLIFHDSQIFQSYREHDFCKMLDQLNRIGKDYGIDIYFHIGETEHWIEEILQRNGLFAIDKVNGMIYENNGVRKILGKSQTKFKRQFVKNHETNYKLVDVTNESDYLIWTDTYRKSFDMKATLSKKILKHVRDKRFCESRFIIYQTDTSSGTTTNQLISQGCCMFYRNTNTNTIGIYCLGTIKSFRRFGIASTLIQDGIRYAIQIGLSPLCVQTLQSDNLGMFYEKNGFKKVYTNYIYKMSVHR